jgi:hypothetical protein
MLDHLQKRVAEALASARTVTLATCGPAGVQAQTLACEAVGLRLYVLVPRTSDQLFNLEIQDEMIAVTPCWQLYGHAHRLDKGDWPPQLALARSAEAPWCELITIRPIRLQIANPEGWGFAETIDVD